MNDLYNKLMSMSDSDFEEIENAEKTLLKSLKAKKLHEFDNVAFDKEGVMYALEDISAGDEIIKNGNVFAKAKKRASCGEALEI